MSKSEYAEGHDRPQDADTDLDLEAATQLDPFPGPTETITYSANVEPVIAAQVESVNVCQTTNATHTNDISQLRGGFAAFSKLIASDTDLQIYRRYDKLVARNLLYYQSELKSLEAALEALDAQDAEAGSDSTHDWDAITRAAAEGDNGRYAVIERLRVAMKEYQEALLRHSRILHLEQPPARSRQAITSWFQRFMPLSGASQDLFTSNTDNDLVALRTPPDQDRLTTFLEKHLSRFLKTSPPQSADMRSKSAVNTENSMTSNQEPIAAMEGRSAAPVTEASTGGSRDINHTAHGSRHPPVANYSADSAPIQGIYYYRESTISSIVNIVSVLLTAILLLGAIFSLYYVQNNNARLGMIAAYTIVFAASIGLLTNARRAEVYATTAAYAAVLVVFISGQL